MNAFRTHSSLDLMGSVFSVGEKHGQIKMVANDFETQSV